MYYYIIFFPDKSISAMHRWCSWSNFQISKDLWLFFMPSTLVTNYVPSIVYNTITNVHHLITSFIRSFQQGVCGTGLLWKYFVRHASIARHLQESHQLIIFVLINFLTTVIKTATERLLSKLLSLNTIICIFFICDAHIEAIMSYLNQQIKRWLQYQLLTLI